MEAVIKVKVSELNATLLERIKSLISNIEDAEVTISVSDKRSEYLGTLDRSISELQNNKDTVTFTMEEFLKYPQ